MLYMIDVENFPGLSKKDDDDEEEFVSNPKLPHPSTQEPNTSNIKDANSLTKFATAAISQPAKK